MDVANFSYADAVFINCPFDNEYTSLLRAIVFCVYRCGFLPVTALAEDNALDNRLLKIEQYVEACRYGIHDLSRTEVNEKGLPRFNMPFELGLFFGAKYFGNKQQRMKNGLIFDRDRFRYLEFISDINGVDIKAHSNNPDIAIKRVRDWLATSSRRRTIPGPAIVQREYAVFSAALPTVTEKAGLNLDELSFNDYCLLVEEGVRTIIAGQ